MTPSTGKLNALPRLDVSWVNSPDLPEDFIIEWRALAERTGVEIYLSPDWFVPWWKHFGEARKLACLVARENGILVGILPFCIETIFLGVLPVRIARLAGTDPHCIVFTLPVEPKFTSSLLQTAFDYLLNTRRCSAISFTPVSERANFLTTLQDLALADSHFKITDQPDGSHVLFDLPDNFADFLTTRLSKKRRSQFRRDLAGLERHFSMQHGRSIPSPAEFDDFVTFHNQQWRAVGKGGHFSDWPDSTSFYSDVAARSNASQGTQIFRLDGAKGPLASQLALMSGNICHWRLPARSLDLEAERLSAGKVGLVVMIQQLIDDGIRTIEAGRGEYSYKLVYGGENVPVHRIVVSASTWFARARLTMIFAWTDLLNLLYYRIWFLKLAPRLHRLTGGKPRPLWRSWIRTRL